MIVEDACSVKDFQTKRTTQLPEGERAAPVGANEGFLFPDLASPKPVTKPRRRRAAAPDRAPQKMPRLSYHERELLDLLRDLARREGHAFPRHAKLAKRLHCCEKTVRTRLSTLHMHGLLSWVWTGRENHYFLAPDSDCPTPSRNEEPGTGASADPLANAGQPAGPGANVGDPLANRGPSGDVRRHGDAAEPRRPPGEADDPQDAPGFTEQIGKTTQQIGKFTDRPHDMSKEDSKESSSSAAAAEKEKAEEDNYHQAIQIFASLEIPAEKLRELVAAVRRHVTKDPDLSLEVARHCQERLADKSAPDIGNWTGYAIRAFQDPGLYGFSQIDGVWRRPPPNGTAKPSPEDRAKADAEINRQREEAAKRDALFRAMPIRTMKREVTPCPK